MILLDRAAIAARHAHPGENGAQRRYALKRRIMCTRPAGSQARRLAWRSRSRRDVDMSQGTDEQATMRLPEPEQIFRTMMGHVASAAVKSAIDLGVFDRIAAGTSDLAGLVGSVDVPERGLRILLDALIGLGILGKTGDRYRLEPLAEIFLVRTSPVYMGAMSSIMGNSLLWERLGRLTDIVHKGGVAGEPNPANRESDPFWALFAEASRGMSVPQAALIADIVQPERFPRARILDLACGSGVYGFTMLERAGQGASLTSLDWPNVLAKARETAAKRNLLDRIEWRPGSIFEADFGSGYDVAIASQIYHHFDLEQNLVFTRRILASLRPGGELVINDVVPDENRAARSFPLVFALVMLTTTDHGDTFTFAQYRGLLERAGFTAIELHEPPMMPSQVITARKPS
jgi:2-polyprenyl-3-methyl-5-hydroxy-6-metoxy-1,4-benzoquinol methylase